MVAAGPGAFIIDCASTGPAVDIDAVVVCHPGQGEDVVLEVEMIDDPLFLQPLGYLLVRLLGLERVDNLHADEIFNLHLNRQGATASMAVAAEFLAELYPGGGLFNIYGWGRSAHCPVSQKLLLVRATIIPCFFLLSREIFIDTGYLENSR
jgi:hypothetical protein